MISLQENKKTIKTVLFVFGISTVLLLISSFFALTQNHKDMDQITGKVTAIDGNVITLTNVRGHNTTIYTTGDTEIRSKDMKLEPGAFVISFGEHDTDGKFITKNIRVIKKR